MTTPNMRQDEADQAVEASGIWVAETKLKAGSLRLSGALMQNITHIAPAIAAFFFTPFVVSLAGAHSVLAYAVGVVVVFGLGVCLTQLAKNFPSAGGYFTYISRTIGPRMGFLSAWTFIFYAPIISGPVAAFFGFILQNQLKSAYGFDFPWWVTTLILIPLVSLMMYLGIVVSVRLLIVLGTLEMLIVLALAVSGLANPGVGGSDLKVLNPSFNPGHIATASGVALAVVFSVQGLTGWEGAVPLAEETQNPRKNVKRSILISIVIVGVLLVVAYWGQVVGWGVNNLKGLVNSPTLPALVLGTKYWGSFWPVVMFALFTSVIANLIACQNVATRMWWNMADKGALPKAVARLHPTRKTPVVAILIQFVMAMGLGLGVGFLLGPEVSFNLLVGLTLVLSIIFIYIVSNIGMARYYWRERRSEFNWFMHFLLPLVTSLVLAYSVVKSFQPFPAAPYAYAPEIVGGWMLVGLGVLYWLHRTRREEWLTRAGDIVSERPETTEELADTATA
ncbi:MAG: APC family permease [Streptosporangiaceae bacterium]